jgi:hypothetical protein
MTPRIVIPAVAFVLVGLGTAQSAPRQANPQRGWNSAPVRLQGLQNGFPTRPAWAQPGECFTDDGYGRFRSCSAGGRG